MNRRTLVAATAIVCLAALPVPGIAGELIPVEDLILESITLLPKRCDTLHHVQTCDNYHVVGTGGGGFTNPVLEEGRSIVLDDREYRVTSVTHGYWLDDGSVVEPMSADELLPGTSGSWVEIRPNAGRVFRAAKWTDDGDGEVGASDLLRFEGQGEARIVDVRYLVRVRATE